jgi:hypothetical protein
MIDSWHWCASTLPTGDQNIDGRVLGLIEGFLKQGVME